MALPSTLHRFAIDLSDVDRGVYEQLEFQLALHPSETVAYAITRVMAMCLEWREGLTFGRGIGAADEPALSLQALHGGTALWVDVGAPSADRLHRASKHADETVVYSHRDEPALRQAWAGADVYDAESIRVIMIDPALLVALEDVFDRRNAWQVLRTENTVYVSVGDASWSAPLRITSVAALSA